MRHLFTILIVLILYGCHSGEKRHLEKIGDISIVHLENIETDSQLLSAIIDSITYLPLVEQDNFLFVRIDKVIVRDKYIYIMDLWGSNSLLVFDETGAFVRKIGNKGQGPGEYSRLYDFDVDSKNIYLYDYNKIQLLKYDLHGNFIEANQTPFRSSALKILENGKYLSALEQENENTKHQVVRIDSDFNVETSFFPFPDKYAEFKTSRHVKNMIQSVDGVLSYTRFCNDTVYIFSEKGELTGGILFDFGSKTVPERYRNDYDLFREEGRGLFTYFTDTPFKINHLWIGITTHQKNNATFVYNTVSNKYYFYDWTPEEVYNIVFANSKYLIGWMDGGFYEMLKNKPTLDSSAMAILQDGGHVLVIYHLKQNGETNG